MRRTLDPIVEAIEAAVERAFDKRMTALLAQAEAAPPPPAPAPERAPETRKFYSVDETAERYGKHRSTVLRWEGSGKLPLRRVMPGGHTAFLASDLDEFDRSRPVVRTRKKAQN